MSYPVIVLPFLKVDGIALFPFIFVKLEADKGNHDLLRHESIHLRQQLEMLVIPFYLCYLVYYLINRFKYSSHDEAYRHIIFEREAYEEERNPRYLTTRGFWAWLRY